MLVPTILHKAEKYVIDEKLLAEEILEEQRTFFLKNFGCARKVYNLYVDYYYHELEKAGYESGDNIPDIRLPEVTAFKKEYPYLKEADSLGLANAKLDFEDAVRHYRKDCDHRTYTKRAKRRAESGTEALSFRGLKGMPKFHSRAHGDFSYTTNCQYPSEGSSLKRPTIRLEGDMLYLPKRKQGVKLVLHRPLPEDAEIGNVTISMDTDGRMYASVEYTCIVLMDVTIRNAVQENDTTVKDRLLFIGLDYSQQDFCVDSDGRKANAPHSYRKSEAKLARLQRELSRMQEGSKNREKKLTEIRRCNVKIRNQRKDFVRKEAHYYAENYDVVCVEDIDLRNMAQCLKLGKNLHDNGFGMFRDLLAKKLEAKGSVLVKVDRWYPSSQICSACGTQNPEVKDLKIREWTCPHCGMVHDRDENAAVNIRSEGERIFADYFRKWLEEDEKTKGRAAARKAVRKRKQAA